MIVDLLSQIAKMQH